jgi:DNA-binding transcriptional LysR family regulator
MLLSEHNVDLIGERVDMAVRIGELPDSDMVATRIGSMRIVVCASPSLLKVHGIPEKPDDLRQIPFVAVEVPQRSPGWHSGAAADLVPKRPKLSVTTAEAAMEAAVLGVGASQLLLYQVMEAVEDGRLKIVLEAFEPTPAPVHLLHAAHGQMPLKMRRFLDFAAPRLRHAIGKLDLRH